MDSREVDVEADDSPWQGYHHARFHEPDMVYHVVSRTFQGRWLLTPSKDFNDIAAGVLGRAQSVYASVKLYACTFLTNHFHLMLSGAPKELPRFMAYVKRELSRRWGDGAGWENGMWLDTYQSTALPTDESQLNCLRYILSQGVKEGLVDVPERWPGIHIAHQMFEGKPLTGRWFNGTAFAKASDKDKARKKPRGINRDDYFLDYQVRVDRLPAFAGLTDDNIDVALARMRREVLEHRPRKKPPSRLELRQLTRKRFGHATKLPPLPWWQNRKRMICWAARDAFETRAYVNRYWTLQRAFRYASSLRNAAPNVCGYPLHVHSPGRFET